MSPLEVFICLADSRPNQIVTQEGHHSSPLYSPDNFLILTLLSLNVSCLMGESQIMNIFSQISFFHWATPDILRSHS